MPVLRASDSVIECLLSEKSVTVRSWPMTAFGSGSAKQPVADMRSLSIVCFQRTLGTAASGQLRTVSVTAQLSRKRTLAWIAFRCEAWTRRGGSANNG